MNETYVNLARDVMKKHNLTTEQLSKYIKTSQSTAWRIANGKVEPRSGTYQKLVDLRDSDELPELAAA